MLEEHYYWCIHLERWIYDDENEFAEFFPPPIFSKWIPKSMMKFMLKRIVGSLIQKQADGHGMGRHSRAEVEEFGRFDDAHLHLIKLPFHVLSIFFRADLTSLSDYLGKKQYLLGDRPCLADIVLFSFVSLIKILPANSKSAFKRHTEDNCQNLLDHHHRFAEQYWPDYQQCKFGCDEQ